MDARLGPVAQAEVAAPGIPGRRPLAVAHAGPAHTSDRMTGARRSSVCG
jgi:hypothetical protein